MATGRIADLGDIFQLSFVPQDFDGTIQYWLNLGAGPFFLVRDAMIEWQNAGGETEHCRLDSATGQWGDLQIEIIHQISPERTAYSDWYNARREGVHHTCMAVDDIRQARKRC